MFDNRVLIVVFGFLMGAAVTFGLFDPQLRAVRDEYRSRLEQQNQEWQQEIISRDMGLYCPTNGRFAFKGECN